jgi:hypothetical protein
MVKPTFRWIHHDTRFPAIVKRKSEPAQAVEKLNY